MTNRPSPTERELEALKFLWEHGPATVREIHRALDQSDGELAYTTVLSLLQTMEQKKLVDHEKRGKAYAYFAVVERDETVNRLTSGFLDRVFDGAVGEFVTRALDSHDVDLRELEDLEALIAKAKMKKRGEQ